MQSEFKIEADSESLEKPKETEEESKNKTGGQAYQFALQDDNDEYSQEEYSETYQQTSENKERLSKTQSNLEPAAQPAQNAAEESKIAPVSSFNNSGFDKDSAAVVETAPNVNDKESISQV